jgi:hypothetical protein
VGMGTMPVMVICLWSFVVAIGECTWGARACWSGVGAGAYGAHVGMCVCGVCCCDVVSLCGQAYNQSCLAKGISNGFLAEDKKNYQLWVILTESIGVLFTFVRLFYCKGNLTVSEVESDGPCKGEPK